MTTPSSAAVLAPSYRGRALDDWTPALIRLALAQADSGDLRLAGELCDALLCDDRVQGCLLALRGLFGLPLTFESGTGKKRRRAKRELEADEDWWDLCPEDQLARLLAWGALLGVAVAELRWTRKGERWLPTLHVWDARWLRWDAATGAWSVETALGGRIPITPGDGKWLLFAPFGSDRPWAHGAWRALARFWLLKRYAVSDWGRYSEQAGGIKVATTGGDDTHRAQLAADLSEAGKDTTVAMPAGWKLEMLGPTGEGFATFSSQIDAANAATAITLLGQNLSTEVTGGSFAAAKVHSEVKDSVLRTYAESLSTTLHDQLLRCWAETNFGDEGAAPWPWWDTTPPRDKSAEMVAFAGAAAQLTAAGVDVRKIAETLGLPMIPLADAAPKQGGELFAYHLSWGLFTINEARARLGLPPLPDGDRLPVSMEGAPGAPAPAAPAAAPPALPLPASK